MVVRTASGTVDQDACLLDSLPDDLLSLVFRHVPTTERLRVCPLVCKRWRQTLASPSPAWENVDLSSFVLTGIQESEAACEWLTRVGGTVMQLRADFQATRSSGYSIEYALRRLPNLNKLELETINARSLQAISSMRHLTHLSIGNIEDSSDILAHHAETLAGLRHLRVVNVRDSDEVLGMSRTCKIFRLTNLTKLELFDVCTEITPCITNLVKLTELRVANLIWQSHLQICTQLGSLTQLEVLYIHAESSCYIPPELAYLKNLCKLALCGNCCIDSLDGKVSSFCNLHTLYFANMPQQLWGGVLDQFQALPKLTTLSFEGCRLDCLPPCVILSTNLTQLNVHNNLLEDLPHGPYLERLQYLDISHNYLSTVPHSLLYARQLKAVDLSYNSNCFKRDCMQITSEGVKVLSSLPCLKYLGLVRYDAEDHDTKLEEEYYKPWLNHEIACLLGLLSRLYIRGVFIDVYRHVNRCNCEACCPKNKIDPLSDGKRWF